jgi:excisionase family DNA binding protein
MTATTIAEREPARQKSEPLAFSVNDFCTLVSLGRTTVYGLIADGKLASVKVGNRRLIPRESALALIAGGGK